MDSQYKLLSELLSDQAAFITSPKTSLANYCPPVSTGLVKSHRQSASKCFSPSHLKKPNAASTSSTHDQTGNPIINGMLSIYVLKVRNLLLSYTPKHREVVATNRDVN